MLENSKPLSVPQLSNKSNVPYAVTYRDMEDFIKSGLVTPIVTAHHKARKDSKYELTDGGKLMALAICVDEKRVLGDRALELQKIFQPERGGDPLTFFVRSVLLNGVNNGLQRYVLDFIRNLIEIAETSNEPNLWKLAQNGVNGAKPSELHALSNAVLQALHSLDDSQKDTVIQYYRTKATDLLFDKAMRSRDSTLQELARMTSRDPEGVFIKFECKNRKCGYVEVGLYVKMEDVIIMTFSGGLSCPKCGKLNTDSRTHDRKGFRPQKIPVQSR